MIKIRGPYSTKESAQQFVSHTKSEEIFLRFDSKTEADGREVWFAVFDDHHPSLVNVPDDTLFLDDTPRWRVAYEGKRR